MATVAGCHFTFIKMHTLHKTHRITESAGPGLAYVRWPCSVCLLLFIFTALAIYVLEIVVNVNEIRPSSDRWMPSSYIHLSGKEVACCEIRLVIWCARTLAQEHNKANAQAQNESFVRGHSNWEYCVDRKGSKLTLRTPLDSQMVSLAGSAMK